MEHSALHFHVDFHIDMCGVDVGVPQPVADHIDIGPKVLGRSTPISLTCAPERALKRVDFPITQSVNRLPVFRQTYKSLDVTFRRGVPQPENTMKRNLLQICNDFCNWESSSDSYIAKRFMRVRTITRRHDEREAYCQNR